MAIKPNHRPNTLKDSPLQYAPVNELGVVFLFAHVAKKLQFKIEEIRPQFPDCIAYRRSGESEKKVRIEFEYHSRNFKSHRHNPEYCDCIVCWQHDWPECPKHIEVIELKRYFGSEPKIWIQPVIKSQWHLLDDNLEIDWGLSKRTSPGDLLLMYRCFPAKQIKDIYIFEGSLQKCNAGWRDGHCYGGQIRKLCILDYPVFLDDFRNHRVLKTANFIKKNMQGNHLVSAYWPYIYNLIVERNPKTKKLLHKYNPENL